MKIQRAMEHAAGLLNVGKSRVYMDPEQLNRVKEAITKDDLRNLIKEGIIGKVKQARHSRSHARVLALKKKKGRKRGHGKRRGKASARMPRKKRWMNSVRSLRRTLRELRAKHPKQITAAHYRKAYIRIKGNYFKGKKYLEKYLMEGTK